MLFTLTSIAKLC